MKNFLFSIFFLFLTVSALQSQQGKPGFDVSALGGFHFAGQYDAEFGNVNIKDSPSYAFNIAYRFPKKMFRLELQYLGQTTSVKLTPYFVTQNNPVEDIDVQVNYFQAAFGYGNPISRITEFFGYTGLGAIYVAPSGSKYESSTNFLISGQLGANIFFTKSQKAGVRLQGGMYVPMTGSGGTYYGSGGAGYTMDSYSALFQFNLSAGLILRFY
jgi:hypothetical protein